MNKALRTLHGWTGITVGVLLFVICLSGAVVVFKHEIDMWANPALRAAAHTTTPIGLDAVVDLVRQQPMGLKAQSIRLPDATTPVYIVAGRDSANVQRKLAVDAATGAVIGEVESELGQLIRLLHVFLFFGPRTIVGLLGVVMLALLFTGVLIHKKMRQDLFTLRWRRSLRAMLVDGHKAIGVWLLLFGILLAFTGAWLGVKPVAMSAAAFLSGQASASAPAKPVSVAELLTAPMLSLDELRKRAEADLPTLQLRQVALRHWDSSNAEASFAGDLTDHIGTGAVVSYRGTDGRQIKLIHPRAAGFWSQFDSLQRPLHFGNFGGLTLKWLYFLLGIVLALLPVTGAWLWIDRQRRQAVTGAA